MAVALSIAAFFCGGFAIVSQSYLAREFLVVFLGNEMSLAVLFFGWFSGVAAGAAVARLKYLSRLAPAMFLICMLLLWAVLLPTALLAVRMSRSILDVAPGTYAPLWKMLLVALLFVAPFSSFVGLTFVTLCRIRQEFAHRQTPVGSVYVAEAVGGVAGGVLFTFVLAGNVAPFTFAFAAFAPLGALIALFLYRSCHRFLRTGVAFRTAFGALLVCAVATVLWLSGRGGVVDNNSHVARMATITRGVVMAHRESRYQDLTAVLLAGQYSVLGNGEMLTTFPERHLNEMEAGLVLTQHGSPREVLVVGGGLEFAASVLEYGAERVDYVDIDGEAVAMSLPFLDARVRDAAASPGLLVHNVDARVFVSNAARQGARYDCVFLRAGEPTTLLLNRLYTKEFFLGVRGCLSESGVLALPVTLAGSYLGGDVGRYAGDVYRTLASVFPEIVATPEVRSMLIAGAREGVVTTSIDVLTERFGERGVQPSLFPAAFGLLFPPERTAEINDELRALPGRVNTDRRPTTYAANLALWAAYSDSRLAGLLASLPARAPWAVAAVLICVAVFVGAPALLRGRSAAAASLAVLYTGLAAMSTTILLIYALQVVAGFVYEWIGALSASFIVGTAVGGAFGTAAAGRRRMLPAAELSAVAAPLVIVGALHALQWLPLAASTGAILVLACLAGIVTGFEFPVAAGVLHSAGFDARRAGSRLEAMDHLGACAGAILTGIVLVPALGITGSLLLVAGVKVVSLSCALRAGLAGR
ncbi:MAG: spermine/spermidine synthase domain-containing protein [Planctomycetota bacterium]|jgi:spermidine synthase